MTQPKPASNNYFNVRKSKKDGSFHARYILGSGGGTGYFGKKLKQCSDQVLLTLESFKDEGILALVEGDKITIKSSQSYDDVGMKLDTLSPELLNELVDGLNSQSPIFKEGTVSGYLGLPQRARR